MEQMYDDFFNEPFPLEESLLSEGFVPPCDIEETDSHFLVSFDLPGIKKDDVKIDLRDHQLTVSGERKEELKGRKSRERYYGAFARSFTLPSNVDADHVDASFEDGVLQVALPKTAVSERKQIPVKEGKRLASKSGKAA
jgi:HSP20 family protein